jgi:hypothetical protein
MSRNFILQSKISLNNIEEENKKATKMLKTAEQLSANHRPFKEGDL